MKTMNENKMKYVRRLTLCVSLSLLSFCGYAGTMCDLLEKKLTNHEDILDEAVEKVADALIIKISEGLPPERAKTVLTKAFKMFENNGLLISRAKSVLKTKNETDCTVMSPFLFDGLTQLAKFVKEINQ